MTKQKDDATTATAAASTDALSATVSLPANNETTTAAS